MQGQFSLTFYVIQGNIEGSGQEWNGILYDGAKTLKTVFKVTSRGVDKDFLAAGEEFGLNEIGNLSGEELCGFIERLIRLKCPENMERSPSIITNSRWGNFTIEARDEKLYIWNIDVAHESKVEVSVQEAVVLVSGGECDYTPTAELTVGELEKVSKRAYNLTYFIRMAVIIILIAGGATAAWIYFEQTGDRFPPIDNELVTNPAEVASLEAQYAGTYITGCEEGDLVFHLTGNGIARLYEYNYSSTLDGVVLEGDDEGTYVYGKKEGSIQAILDEREIVNLTSNAEIEFYKDIYYRYPGILSELWQERFCPEKQVQ